MPSIEVSIVVPVKTFNKNLDQCLSRCLNLNFSNFELICLPDNSFNYDNKVNIIATGPIGPSEKRDLALKKARGKYLAFIDDDAYPCKNWLKFAIRHFDDDQVAAVGGPGVTPKEDSPLQKASGYIYESFWGSGSAVNRYLQKKEKEVDDWPSCNLIVRKNVMQEIGGFGDKFWPGEDTLACQRIIGLGHKIIYDPNVLIYHHRRKLFKPHLLQIWNYGLHRGYFVRKFRGNSLKVNYFIPSLFVIFLVGGLFSLFQPLLTTIYFSFIAFYLLFIFIASIKIKSIKAMHLVFFGIILTHLAYGISFIKGFFSGRLKEE